MTDIFDIVLDSLIDCLKLLPFLLLSYLAVEYMEHRMSDRAKEWIYGAGWAGPVLGSLIGIIPQCGFSAAAAGFFAARVISPGTLLAVFLSTSDEMLPLMISQGVHVSMIVRILAAKVIAGACVGLLVDVGAIRLGLWKPVKMRARKVAPRAAHVTHVTANSQSVLKAGKTGRRNYEAKSNARTADGDHSRSGNVSESENPEILHMCEHGHCHCEEQGIFRAALNHTAQTAVFLFLISLVLGFVMEWFGDSALSRGIFAIPGIQAALAALIGMIPNCAASVLITQLYLEGVIASGSLFAGLLCGAGTGLLVLFRENDNRRENLMLVATLYVSGTLAGLLIGVIGVLA